MKLITFPRRDDADHLQRRGALALLCALVVALAVGLLAWGPLRWSALAASSTLPAAFGTGHLLGGLLGSAALVLAGWNGWRAPQADGPAAQAWRWFFASTAGLGVFVLLQAICVAPAALATEFCGAAGLALVFAGLMADRVHPALASAPARRAALLLAACAAVWWGRDLNAAGAGDLRGLLFLTALPLLLLPAGVAGLRSGHPRAGDALILLAALELARLVPLADGLALPPALLAGLHVLMQFVTAAAVVWFARRLGPVAVSGRQPPERSGAAPSARSTSLKT